jgi:hypothetical protein
VPGLILTWSPLAFSLLNLAFYVALWIVGKTLVSKQELEEVRGRIAHLEEIAEAAPGWTVLNELRTRIAAFDGDLKGVGAKMEGLRDMLSTVQNTIELVQQHLLDGERS